MSASARYQRIGLLTLAAGLLAAGVVYRCTTPLDYQPVGMVYRVEGGTAYAVDPGDLKQNQMDSWTKANVRTMQFLEWGATWLHGRRLAYTIAGVSVGGFLICFFLANFEFSVASSKKPPGGGEPRQR